ncbi:MAG: OmpH family outer membrane protein [Desulfuromonadales bacterium]|nr:OmpH family outer membrane protein [Desulfuromonadales bacterium]
MSRTSTKILLALLICTLPSLGVAAESAPAAAETKTTAPVQVTAPAPTTPVVPPATSPVTLPAVPSLTPAAVKPAATSVPGLTLLPKTAEAPKPQQLKLGYVDIARVSAESSLGKASAAQAKQKQEKFQTQIQAKRKQLDKQKAALEAQFPTLNPTQRDAKAKEFQKKVESFQKFGMGAEKELQTLQEGLGKSFSEAIEQAAMEYGKANGLALVVVKREMLYVSSEVDAQDVSEGIIKLMNEKWKKK